MSSRRSTWKRFVLVLIVLAITTAGCLPIQWHAMQPGRQPEQQRGAHTAMGARFANVTDVDSRGLTRLNTPLMQTTIANMPVGTLTDDEKAGLLFMREEEKLAHDVYVTLRAKWALPIFQNISNSEQTHTDAIKLLLERYALTDPATDKAVGTFVEPTLQNLYDQLVEKGNQSLADALTVGATIEDLDIVDLQTRLAQTDKVDIQLVYENLLKGSRNHLRAFTQSLTREAGMSYTPQYLNQEAFDAIVNAPIERGPAR